MPSMPSRKVVISADGSVIPSGDADEGSASTSSCLAPAPGRGVGTRPNRRSSTFPSLSSQERIDFFGFSLLPMQCLAIVATSLLMLGIPGTAGIFVLFILYQRCGLNNGVGSSSSSSSRLGNSSRWGERTGSNIKGVLDLPKPPPSS